MHQVTSVLDEPGVDGTLTPGGRSQQSGPPNVYVIDGYVSLLLSTSRGEPQELHLIVLIGSSISL